MIFNENDKNIKKVNEDIKSTFIDEIFNEYFFENNGFFKIHDKKQQKIPVMNIYKVKNWEYSDIDIFILDIALGLYSKEDFSLDMIEDRGRYFLSITVNKKELPNNYEPLVKQISTNYGRRVIEFADKIDSIKILDTRGIPGIIRIEVITKPSNHTWNTINMTDNINEIYHFKK